MEERILKKKYLKYSIVLLVFALIVLSGMKIIQHEKNSFRIIVSTEDGDFYIQPIEKEKSLYVYLPSYAKLEQIRVKSGFSVTPLLNKKKINSNEMCTISDKKNNNLQLKLFGIVSIMDKNIIFEKSEKLPVLNIESKESVNKIEKNQNVSMAGEYVITSSNGKTVNSGKVKKMHIRGNTALLQPKKSYLVKLDEEENLLNMGKSNKWILLSNACDESNLRNKIVYDSAMKIGLNNSPKTSYVDLYINGEYKGIYLLAEKIAVEKNRIDIKDLEKENEELNNQENSEVSKSEITEDDIYKKGFVLRNNPKDISGGYLVELELPFRVAFVDSVFTTKMGQSVSLKHPEIASKEEVDYISKLFQKIEDNLEQEAEVEKYIDIDSWVKYYVIQEMFANTEETSFYFYKDSDLKDGKVYAGPVWDFDLAIGNCYAADEVPANCFYVNTWGWFQKLYNTRWFQERVKKCYKGEGKKILEDILDQGLDSYVKEIAKSSEMNFLRWEGIQQYEYCRHYKEYRKHKEEIEKFLRERMSFLDDAWINDFEYRSVRVYNTAPKEKRYFYTVNKGDTLEALKKKTLENYEFLGWKDRETGESVNENTKIEKNGYYYSEWKSTLKETKMDKIKSKIMRHKKECMILLISLLVAVCVLCIVIIKRKIRKE